MNRRGFFYTLLAPLAAKWVSRPITRQSSFLAGMDAYACEAVAPAITDNFFTESPLFARLRMGRTAPDGRVFNGFDEEGA